MVQQQLVTDACTASVRRRCGADLRRCHAALRRVKCRRLVGLAKASQDRRQTMCIFLASISSDNYTVFTEDGFPVLFQKYFFTFKAIVVIRPQHRQKYTKITASNYRALVSYKSFRVSFKTSVYRFLRAKSSLRTRSLTPQQKSANHQSDDGNRKVLGSYLKPGHTHFSRPLERVGLDRNFPTNQGGNCRPSLSVMPLTGT